MNVLYEMSFKNNFCPQLVGSTKKLTPDNYEILTKALQIVSGILIKNASPLCKFGKFSKRKGCHFSDSLSIKGNLRLVNEFQHHIFGGVGTSEFQSESVHSGRQIFRSEFGSMITTLLVFIYKFSNQFSYGIINFYFH